MKRLFCFAFLVVMFLTSTTVFAELKRKKIPSPPPQGFGNQETHDQYRDGRPDQEQLFTAPRLRFARQGIWIEPDEFDGYYNYYRQYGDRLKRSRRFASPEEFNRYFASECNQNIEKADRYLGPNNEFGREAHEIVCGHYGRLFVSCFYSVRDMVQVRSEAQLATFCALQAIGYNHGHIAWQDVKRRMDFDINDQRYRANDPRIAKRIQLGFDRHAEEYFYDAFYYEFGGKPVMLRFVQRPQDQDDRDDFRSFNYAAFSRQAKVSILTLDPGIFRKNNNEYYDEEKEWQFRVNAFTAGYNIHRKFIYRTVIDKIPYFTGNPNGLTNVNWWGKFDNDFNACQVRSNRPLPNRPTNQQRPRDDSSGGYGDWDSDNW